MASKFPNRHICIPPHKRYFIQHFYVLYGQSAVHKWQLCLNRLIKFATKLRAVHKHSCIFLLSAKNWNRYSDGLDDRGVGVLVPVGARIFFFSTSCRPPLGSTQPPIQWVPWALSPGVKRPGREADHSPPASAEVKKMCIYGSTPQYAFMA
jgi:hypothetical protein